jgi:phosphatidylethanolamine N-methyltransferase
MYSIGYAGFYGISLMTASYRVLFMSILAHASQFAFLILVETPHIEKTYSKPAPRRTRHTSETPVPGDRPATTQSEPTFADSRMQQPAPTHHIVGPQNMDLHRSIDVTVMLLSFYMFCLATLAPNTYMVRTLLFVHAFAWRIWYVLGLGYILDRQSKKQNWTRHFVKYGDSKEEAWRQWKSLYYLSMVMCHASLAAAAWKMYKLPADWYLGLTLLRHVLGVGLLALQLYTSAEIYESLGEFGFFSGDFMWDPPTSNLTYSGIYRFLNNPERVLGLAGVWGTALITWNAPMFYLAATAHILNLAFLQFVEKKHMQK